MSIDYPTVEDYEQAGGELTADSIQRCGVARERSHSRLTP